MSLAGHSSHRIEVQVLIVNHVSFMEVPWKVRLVKDIHGCVSDFYLQAYIREPFLPYNIQTSHLFSILANLRQPHFLLVKAGLEPTSNSSY